MATNLPPKEINDSGAATRIFFDQYGVKPTEYKAVEVDAAVNFFNSAGFGNDASTVSGLSILKQAKREGVSVFVILDGLRKLNAVQISTLVAQILNSNRVPTSALGFRTNVISNDKSREISA